MLNARYTEGLLKTADGPRIAYRDYPSEGPETGPPVLCLHGLTRNLRDFDELAPRIAALGRRVVTASQRGRGQSDADPAPERYNPAVYAGDMIALLDHLGIERAVFVGTSMGGLMTMIVAMQAPGKVAAAVLNDVGPVVSPEGLERIRSYVGGDAQVSSWREAASYCRSINGVAFPKETSESYWETFARKLFHETAPGRLELEYDPAISKPFGDAPPDAVDLWPFFDALKAVPVLSVRGGLSDVLSAETVAEMQARKPDMQVATAPDIGHAPFMTEPAAFAALSQFISQT